MFTSGKLSFQVPGKVDNVAATLDGYYILLDYRLFETSIIFFNVFGLYYSSEMINSVLTFNINKIIFGYIYSFNIGYHVTSTFICINRSLKDSNKLKLNVKSRINGFRRAITLVLGWNKFHKALRLTFVVSLDRLDMTLVESVNHEMVPRT